MLCLDFEVMFFFIIYDFLLLVTIILQIHVLYFLSISCFIIQRYEWKYLTMPILSTEGLRIIRSEPGKKDNIHETLLFNSRAIYVCIKCKGTELFGKINTMVTLPADSCHCSHGWLHRSKHPHYRWKAKHSRENLLHRDIKPVTQRHLVASPLNSIITVLGSSGVEFKAGRE